LVGNISVVKERVGYTFRSQQIPAKFTDKNGTMIFARPIFLTARHFFGGGYQQNRKNAIDHGPWTSL
jgi:hypothetical protein